MIVMIEFLMMMMATCWFKEYNHDRCDDDSARFASLANLDLANAQILFCSRINFFNQYQKVQKLSTAFNIENGYDFNIKQALKAIVFPHFVHIALVRVKSHTLLLFTYLNITY